MNRMTQRQHNLDQQRTKTPKGHRGPCLLQNLHLPLTPGALRGPQRQYFCYNDERIKHRGGSSFNRLWAQLCFMHVVKCIESNHGDPLIRCPLCFGVSLFVPGLPDTKLKISRAESRNVTEPKVATPRRSTRIAHLNAVPPREALRTALV